jgi:hypothetical protein
MGQIFENQNVVERNEKPVDKKVTGSLQDFRTENRRPVFIQGEVRMGKSRGKTMQRLDEEEEGVVEM